VPGGLSCRGPSAMNWASRVVRQSRYVLMAGGRKSSLCLRRCGLDDGQGACCHDGFATSAHRCRRRARCDRVAAAMRAVDTSEVVAAFGEWHVLNKPARGVLDQGQRFRLCAAGDLFRAHRLSAAAPRGPTSRRNLARGAIADVLPSPSVADHRAFVGRWRQPDVSAVRVTSSGSPDCQGGPVRSS
jgi:hypothetical protein